MNKGKNGILKLNSLKLYKTKEYSGITLIALVITIIVLLILAGVSINLVTGENGILEQAQNASLKQKFAKYKEELELGMFGQVTVAGEQMKNYIQTLSDEDVDKFVIINGALGYIGEDTEEKEIAESLEINATMSGSGAEAVEDIQNIVNKVITLKDSVTVPADDSMATPSGLVGIRLYDKTSQNGDRWRIVIDYNDLNQEIGRYGSGNYLLKAGKTYNINGENVSFSKDYIVNYKDATMIGLTDKAVEWSLESTLAVNEGLVLNIDPTNVADGNWTGLTKHGDVKYDATSKALLFNEDSVNNPNGEGGYLETTRSGIDFSDGFTFEIYANLSRMRYDNGSGYPGLGMFCRMPTLNSIYHMSMRFGISNGQTICKFNYNSSWTGTIENMFTMGTGDIQITNCGYSENEDFYLTFVYRVYDATKEDENYDDYMRENGVDKIEYYVNGELFGYTYYGHDSYINGLNTWNNDSCPFYLGVSPWEEDGNLYYLKGKVYTTRLYTTSMTPEQVKENMDMTQRYRSSF